MIHAKPSPVESALAGPGVPTAPSGPAGRVPSVLSGRAWSGVAWALLSSACFGASGTVAKSLMAAGWSPGATVTARVLVAALLMAVPAVVALRGRWGVLRSHAWLVVGYAVLGIVLTQLCYFLAIERLSVAVALLLEYTAPVLVVGWLWARHGERPGRLTLAGVAAAMAGLVLVLDLAGDVRLDALGVLFALGAAGGLAGYFVLSARPAPELPQITLVGGGMVVGAALLVGLGLTGVLPMTWTTDDVVLAGHLVPVGVPVAILALVTAVLAYSTGLLAARRLGSRVASFVCLTEVLFAVAFAWMFLGEIPTAAQAGGGLLVVLGAVAVKVAEAGGGVAEAGVGVAEAGPSRS
ncbi:EamA family transporter [Agilicoccus flavus]|uniref:EamA family transporter n=1 Tax=Agilicoccus flavus TaxID=2775968 RepID=UPI001CF6E942|nr:EamA family transporter [Agilicoccus flavus]